MLTKSAIAYKTVSAFDIGDLYELILDTSAVFTHTPCLSKGYEEFALALKTMVGFDRIHITFFDQTARTVITYYHFGRDTLDRYPGLTRPLAGARIQQVLETGQTIIEEDLASGQLQSAISKAALRSGLRSGITVALFSRGEIMGALSLRCRQPRAYGPREQAILELLATLIAPAIERDRLVMQSNQVDDQLSGTVNLPQDTPPDLSGNSNHQQRRQSYLGVVLSAREQCVMKHVTRGSSNAEIAEALHLSINTVKSHVKHILRKLQVPNRIQATLVVNGQPTVER